MTVALVYRAGMNAAIVFGWGEAIETFDFPQLNEPEGNQNLIGSNTSIWHDRFHVDVVDDISFLENHTSHVTSRQIIPHQISSPEVGVPQYGVSEVTVTNSSTNQGYATQIGSTQVDSNQAGFAEGGSTQIGSTQVCSIEIEFIQSLPAQIDTSHVQSMEMIGETEVKEPHGIKREIPSPHLPHSQKFFEGHLSHSGTHDFNSLVSGLITDARNYLRDYLPLSLDDEISLEIVDMPSG